MSSHGSLRLVVTGEKIKKFRISLIVYGCSDDGATPIPSNESGIIPDNEDTKDMSTILGVQLQRRVSGNLTGR